MAPVFPPPSLMEVDLNGSSFAEFLNILGWRSSACLHGIRSLSTSKHLVVFILFHFAFQIILSMCMIALVYLFSFHRTCFSSSNPVPVNVSSKYFFLFEEFFLRIENSSCLHGEWQGETGSGRRMPRCAKVGVTASLSFPTIQKAKVILHQSAQDCWTLASVATHGPGNFPFPGGRKLTEIS